MGNGRERPLDSGHDGPAQGDALKDGNQLSQETISGKSTTRPCGCDDGTVTTTTFHARLPLPGDGGVSPELRPRFHVGL